MIDDDVCFVDDAEGRVTKTDTWKKVRPSVVNFIRNFKIPNSHDVKQDNKPSTSVILFAGQSRKLPQVDLTFLN